MPKRAAVSCIVAELGLLLGLNRDYALVEVFVVDLCGIAPQSQHASLHAHLQAPHSASRLQELGTLLPSRSFLCSTEIMHTL